MKITGGGAALLGTEAQVGLSCGDVAKVQEKVKQIRSLLEQQTRKIEQLRTQYQASPNAAQQPAVLLQNDTEQSLQDKLAQMAKEMDIVKARDTKLKKQNAELQATAQVFTKKNAELEAAAKLSQIRTALAGAVSSQNSTTLRLGTEPTFLLELGLGDGLRAMGRCMAAHNCRLTLFIPGCVQQSSKPPVCQRCPGMYWHWVGSRSRPTWPFSVTVSVSVQACKPEPQAVKPSSRDPLDLLQEDGSVELRHQACSVGHMCTFSVTQSMANSGGAQANPVRDGAHQSLEVKTTYTVSVTNLGTGEGEAALIKMNVLGMCGLKQRSASQTKRETSLLDSSSTSGMEQELKQHAVYFLHNRDGSCSDYCFNPEDHQGIRHAKKTIMREFCTPVTATDALTRAPGPVTSKPGELYQITHSYGVEAPFTRHQALMYLQPRPAPCIAHTDPARIWHLSFAPLLLPFSHNRSLKKNNAAYCHQQ